MGPRETSSRVLDAAGRGARRLAAIEARNLPGSGDVSTIIDPTSWLLSATGGLPTMSGARVTELTSLGVPTAYACINLLGNLVGKLPCRVIRKTAAGHEEIPDHPVTRLLKSRPNEQHTPFEFRRLVQARVGGTGIGYARIYRDDYYRPIALVPIRSCNVQITTPGPGQIRYRVQGERDILTRADLLQVNALSTDGFGGLSPITLLRESLGLAMAQRDSVGAVLKNGARFPGYLAAPGALTADQIKDARAQMDMIQTGVVNNGKIPILWGGWQYLDKSAGMSMADMEFLSSRAFENDEICKVFGIPPVLIGATDKVSSWGTGIEQINMGFLMYGLDPWLINWEQAVGFSLLTEQEMAQGFEVAFDRTQLNAANLAARGAFYQQMRMIGALSVNDIRREIGQNDLPDNIGDNYQLPFNNQGGVQKPDPADKKTEPEPVPQE